jgi:hypothetical protein
VTSRGQQGAALVAFLLLAGCGQAAPDLDVIANAEAAAAGDRIDCAPAGAAAFEASCTIERAQTDQGLILTLRQPDGGFHRLLKTDDGRGVIAADGAEAATVSVIDPATIEVAIGGTRYRLPATVGPLPKP